MANFEYLADEYHVDEAGNLICYTYMDLRPEAARLPVGALKRASSKRYVIPRLRDDPDFETKLLPG